MRISEVINMMLEFMLPCTVLGAITITTIVIGYYLVYKKLFHGTKTLQWRKMFVLFVLVAYMGIVLIATLTSRGGGIGYSSFQTTAFLQSYIEAWYCFSLRSWRLLILNIMMFVPFGFLLPCVWNRCRKFWFTYLAGLLMTVAIEVTQKVTGRGIFEVDDILNNTAGCMIGYGFFVLVSYIWLQFKKADRQKHGLRNVFAAQLPLILTVSTFVCIFTAYHKKELGNLYYQYIENVSMKDVLVETKLTFSEETEKSYVYQATRISKEDALTLAKQVMGADGEEPEPRNTIVYDESIYYKNRDERVSFFLDYLGPNYHYTRFEYFQSECTKGLQESEVKKILKPYGIEIPDKATFQEAEDGSYIFQASLEPVKEYLADGELHVSITDGDKVYSIDNRMVSLSKYKEYELISEQEAFQRIQKGKFRCYHAEAIQSITVNEVSLTYVTDTKGFYQPAYSFGVTLNGEEGSIIIPAIK